MITPELTERIREQLKKIDINLPIPLSDIANLLYPDFRRDNDAVDGMLSMMRIPITAEYWDAAIKEWLRVLEDECNYQIDRVTTDVVIIGASTWAVYVCRYHSKMTPGLFHSRRLFVQCMTAAVTPVQQPKAQEDSIIDVLESIRNGRM